jgi:glutathione S-transferase
LLWPMSPRAVNPMMTLPALTDGDGPILFESLAIIEYLTHPNPPPLPRDARGRACVRGLAQIVACDSHPLIVPRVREYLEHEFKLDEPTRIKWCQHWHTAALTALEAHQKLAATGRYCHGEAAGAKFFSVDTAPFSNFTRIANSLSTDLQRLEQESVLRRRSRRIRTGRCCSGTRIQARSLLSLPIRASHKSWRR